MTRNSTQRISEAYRRARRKLMAQRHAGPHSVASYLVLSHLARRVSGLEAGRPESVAGFQLTEDELRSYQEASLAADANGIDGQDGARTRRHDAASRKLYLPRMHELLDRLFSLGGQQIITFGFADDSSRRVLLLSNGQDIPDDGNEHTPLANLVERLFTDLHGCVISVRTEPGQTVSVYEAAGSRFHQEPRREIYAAAVISQMPIYFSGRDAERNLGEDPRTLGPLPRVPGTTYKDWPMASTDQGKRT